MSWWRSCVLCTALVFVLTACGGGGGGGGDSGSGGVADPKVQIDKTEINITADQNETGVPQRISATLSSAPTFRLFIAAEATAPGIASLSMTFPSSTSALVDVVPDTSLSPGTYTGQLLVRACRDEACRTQLAGSPYSVTFSVIIRPGFVLTPNTLSLTAISGNEASDQVAVQLPSGVSDYQVTGILPSWLVIENRTPTGFTVRARSTPLGVRTTSVSVVAGSRSFSLPISLATSAPLGGEHDLTVNPAAVDLGTVEGASVTADIAVTEPTWHPVLATVTSYPAGPVDWLSLTPVTGGYRLTASAAALPAGTYSAQVTVTGDEFTTTRTLPVALTVGPGLVQIAPRTYQVRGDTTPLDLTESIRIQQTGGPAHSWSATSDQPWLKVDTASGTTGDFLRIRVDQVEQRFIPNNSSATGNIVVTAGAPLTPLTFSVTVDKQLPVLRYVVPDVVTASAPQKVILSGSGFLQLADPASRIAVGNLSAVAVTRRSDTELELTLPADASGTYSINLNNGMAENTRTTSLSVEARLMPTSPAPPETRIAQTGTKFAMVHDIKRDSLLVLNGDLGAIQRYAYFPGGPWVTKSVSIAALNGIGISPDESFVIATTSNGLVLLLDPVTLDINETHQVDAGGIYVMQGATAVLPVTNDGRVWIARGDGNHNTLWTFDLFTRQFEPAALGNISTSFFGGPWGVTSGNGERLLLSQTASLSPQPPILFLDARDGVLRTSPLNPLTDAGFFFFATYNQDGSRLLVDGGRVLDGSFATVGQAALPAGNIATAAFSPDGKRIYALGYPASFGTPGAPPPTIWVLDASSAAVGGVTLPVLGSFAIASSPTCEPTPSDSSCFNGPKMRVSTDGRTIFLAGQAAFMAVRVPDSIAFASTPGVVPLRARASIMPRQVQLMGSRTTGRQ